MLVVLWNINDENIKHNEKKLNNITAQPVLLKPVLLYDLTGIGYTTS